MNNAVIIGKGMVGKATMLALHIPNFIDLKESNITLEEAAKKRFIFICLPTVTDEFGTQDESYDLISNYIKRIQKYKGNNIFIIRSTVLPETCRILAKEHKAIVVSNPEFLSESSWEQDTLKPRMKVIGADNKEIAKEVIEVWKDIKAPIEIVTDTVTAEMIKYTFNTFAVTKVIFANQIYDACQSVKADYKVIHEALHSHPWGSKHHLQPIDKGGRGAGGRCLSKDLKAFQLWSGSELLETVQKLNNNYLGESAKG